MQPLTVGVEEELHVIDRARGDLVPRASEVIAAAVPALGDLVGCELNLCQVETRSPVCEDLDEVEAFVRTSRRALADAAQPYGLGVVANATHPFGRWQDQRVDRSQPRYRALEDVYQELARQQIICGCHVHVGVPDRDALVSALTTLRAWLPVLLALSANSPFWQGHETGYASFRQQVWRRWPTSGLPPPVYSAAEYDRIIADLIASRAVPDESYLYWDARPSSRYPTLEVRVLDTCLDPDDVVAIAGLIRALVWTCVNDSGEVAGVPVLQRTEVIESAMWSAARYGLDGRLWSPVSGEGTAAAVVDELLLRCMPGLLAHGDEDRVTAAVQRIVRRGSGATFQRQAFAARGGRSDLVGADLLTATLHGTQPVAADVA